MSFRCELCNRAMPAGTSPVVLILERRQKNYPERTNGKKVIDRGGRGWEIAKEAKACKKCATPKSEAQ